jgi:DNA replication protein DnaC
MNWNKPDPCTCVCGERIELVLNPFSGRWLRPAPLCPRCEDKEEIVQEELRRKERQQNIRKRIEGLLARASIPPRFVHCTLSNYQTTLATRYILDRVSRFVSKETTQGLFLFGSSGVGKTHLAAALAREYLLEGKEVLFTNMLRLLLEIRQTFDERSDPFLTEKNLLDRYRKIPVLILDDLGTEQITPWSTSIFSMVLNDRYEEIDKRLVVTSNLNLKQIEKTYSMRIASRIAGMCILLKVVGQDYRLKRR